MPPEKISYPKRKGLSSNPSFSGAIFLDSGRVAVVPFPRFCWAYVISMPEELYIEFLGIQKTGRMGSQWMV